MPRAFATFIHFAAICCQSSSRVVSRVSQGPCAAPWGSFPYTGWMRAALLLLLFSSVVHAQEARYSVLLTDAGPQKINIIKIVREYTALGLKDAKDLVEAPKPKLVRAGLSRDEATALLSALTAQGASAEVKQEGGHPGAPVVAVVPERFEVKLESWGASKIQVIKIVRERTGLGLAETKTLVESAPAVMVKGLNRAQAESMVAELLAVGAKAVLVPAPAR